MINYLRRSPFLLPSDTFERAEKFFLRYKLPEIPVVKEKEMVGVVKAQKILKLLLKGYEVRKLRVRNLMEKGISINYAELKILAKKFREKGSEIIWVREAKGFVRRIDLLNELKKEEESIEKFVSKDFFKIKLESSLKYVLKKCEKDAIVAFKGKKPWRAISYSQLCRLAIINRVFEKKVEESSFLQKVLRQKEMYEIWEKRFNHVEKLIKVSDFLDKPLLIGKDWKVGRVCRLMVFRNESVVVNEEGKVVKDLDLLKLL